MAVQDLAVAVELDLHEVDRSRLETVEATGSIFPEELHLPLELCV
jgi:hypothetical protein